MPKVTPSPLTASAAPLAGDKAVLSSFATLAAPPAGEKVVPSFFATSATQLAGDEPGTGSLKLRKVWDEFEKGDKNFFSSIHLAKGGGFSEVGMLFTFDRFFWASISIACLILNLTVIIQPNVQVLLEMKDVAVDEDDSPNFLLGNVIIAILMGGGRVSPDVLLAILELALLVFHLARGFWVGIRCIRGDSLTRWHCAATILWDVVPDLRSFSAMRLLHYVTPKIFVPSFTRHVRWAMSSGKYRYLLMYLLGTLCVGFVGVEAFMIKFVMTSRRRRSSTSLFEAVLVAAAFMNQMVGVVDVNKFAQRRLFIFIFGGEDSFVSEYEARVARTWMAMLAMHMWKESKQHRPRLLWFLVIGLAYGDSDFQQLTLDDVVSCQKGTHLGADAAGQCDVVSGTG